MDVVRKIIFDDENEDDDMWRAVIYSVEFLAQHYKKYIKKEPCMDSFQTGIVWLLKIMRGNEIRCINMFRMDKNTLINLCRDLEMHYGLAQSNRMSILEKVGIFLYVLAQGASNRAVQERFQHSGETVSRIFHEVLKAMIQFSIDMIKPKDQTFSTIPTEILNDGRYMPYFKDCIGAIDGTHVLACVKEKEIVLFIGRKGMPTQNIMTICSFDMLFTFVLAGWEGTAHDSRLFQYAINKKEMKFPKPPLGKYYLVDAGYPQIEGYLTPYKGTRYHLPDFQRGGRPKGYKETFNRWHSSLRCCIERTFGVWKARWRILRAMPSYAFPTQRDIVIASMALHNYIRKNTLADPGFDRLDANPDFVPYDSLSSSDDIDTDENLDESGATQMNVLRDQIAFNLFLDKN